MKQYADFEDLESVLERADASAGAAEAHGILCGMFCSQGQVQRAQWIQEVLGHTPDGSDVLMRETIGLLEGVYRETQEQLHDTDLGFEPLLPDDSRSIQERVGALGEWCQGFVLGFSLVGTREKGSVPADVDELLADFIEITRVQAESDAEGENGEQFYMQIVEYVRMGVLLIYEELHPVHGAPGLQ